MRLPVTPLAVPGPPAVVGAMLLRGGSLLALGDISRALRFFGRASASGSGTAALAMGSTNAPSVLAGIGVRGIGITPRHHRQDVALARRRHGEIEATVFVAGKPARPFTAIEPGSGLRFLPLRPTPALLETDLPTSIDPADHPNLIPQGNSVETIAALTVMAVLASPPGTERQRKVSRFVLALKEKSGEFLCPPRQLKWRAVNLAAEVPGWTRFDHTR